MPSVRQLATRAIHTGHALRAFGPVAARRLIACGAGMSVASDAQAHIDIGPRVTFGRGCGIAVIGRPGSAPAELRIGMRTSFQSGLSLNCATRVTIGAHCAISWDVHILDNDFHQIIQSDGSEPERSRPITIADRVWIGARVTVLKGVTIGADSVVAAGSVVTRSFPPRSLIGGNPARLIKPIQGWRL